MQTIETKYTQTIDELKILLERTRRQNKVDEAGIVNATQDKNEMENLFVDCIEEVRKDIMKRRLKNEIYNRKKFQAFEKGTNEAKEFEDSLIKLAQLAKNRVKIAEFSGKDKNNLLDLFVNNERILLMMYEALFPHRAAPGGVA